MAAVTLEHVCKVYPNGVRAVSDLSLTVADGERVVLVGPSGSGKSTALRLIAGLEEVDAGTLRIDGRVVNRMAPRDRNVAMVFQRPTFYPHLSVRGNLAFGYRLREGTGRIPRLFDRMFRPTRHAENRRREKELAQRVDEAARLLELHDVLDRLPRQLSGGQQQRVALGRALVRRPAVFLLDEPLSNLEPRLRTDLRRELHLLQRHLHATMIYVTHDQTEALTFGERVVVLDRGVVQQADRPEALYQRPRNRFVAGFIGWPPMNFVTGMLREESGRRLFQGDDWALALPDGLAVDWKGQGGTGAADHDRLELGIRPEQVVLAAPQSGPTIAMTIELIETLGGKTLVTCSRGGLRLTSLVTSPSGLDAGKTIEVGIDMTHVYLFDVVTGLTLSAPTE